ncbi:MAG TPA: hypothetical protein VGO90_17820 [Chthoniobacteraceae bacterium]|nr:hypothetical protein [Chthoniobacteraceae bacterium]
MKPSESLATPSLEQRVASLERGTRAFAVTFLLLACVPNLALVLSLPSTTAVFVALFELSPLPTVTRFLLKHPHYFVGLAVVWPVAGTLITLRARQPFQALTACCIYTVLAVAQFGITWFALLLPFRNAIARVPGVVL